MLDAHDVGPRRCRRTSPIPQQVAPNRFSVVGREKAQEPDLSAFSCRARSLARDDGIHMDGQHELGGEERWQNHCSISLSWSSTGKTRGICMQARKYVGYAEAL